MLKQISLFFRVFLFSFFYFAQLKVHATEWKVDLSRRQTDFDRIQNVRMPASNVSTPEQDSEVLERLKQIVNPVVPSQDIVIMQTENGFVPAQISLKKDEVYKIHIVNLNSREKNVSFIMDSFSQSHNTVFGVSKSFTLQPKVEGVFSYQCPETGISGQLVVVPPAQAKKENRKLASEN